MKIQFFEGNAFTGTKDKPLGQIPIGNPALICFSDNLFDDCTMSKIAQQSKSPMTTFIAPTNDKQSFFIRFYSPKGFEVDLCGHASIVSSYFITITIIYFFNASHKPFYSYL